MQDVTQVEIMEQVDRLIEQAMDRLGERGVVPENVETQAYRTYQALDRAQRSIRLGLDLYKAVA